MSGLFTQVTSRTGAEAALRAGAPLAAVVSITDPGREALVGVDGVGRRLELQFADVLDAKATNAPPTADHVRRVLAFASTLEGAEGAVLVHCEKGQSRSTAVAILLEALWLGPRREGEAVERVFAHVARPWANPLIIDLADRALGRGGALAAAFAERASL